MRLLIPTWNPIPILVMENVVFFTVLRHLQIIDLGG